MFGIVTLKVLVVVCPLTSVAVTVVPDVPIGTAKVQLNDSHVPLAIRDPARQAVTGRLSKTNATVLGTEKPVPDTVTVAPAGPWFGATSISGAVGW